MSLFELDHERLPYLYARKDAMLFLVILFTSKGICILQEGSLVTR
ncbi:hypothetical protein ACDX66_17425 [Peribacillus frigoritolerans]